MLVTDADLWSHLLVVESSQLLSILECIIQSCHGCVALLQTPFKVCVLLQMSEETNATCSNIVSVCVGEEWYRYPSSFFLPGPAYRLQFVKSGFDGMLPLPFDANQVREEASASC